MYKLKILINGLTIWAMIMSLSPARSFAQTPTKQETIDWIKEKIQKHPGCAYSKDNYSGEMDSIKTTVSGDYITTTFISKVHRKRLIITETFSLYDIVADDGYIQENNGYNTIIIQMPKGKIELHTNIDGYEIPGYSWGQVHVALYWPAEYDLENRMIKALKNLSDYNKPHETY